MAKAKTRKIEIIDYEDFKLDRLELDVESRTFVVHWTENQYTDESGEYLVRNSQTGFEFINYLPFKIVTSLYPHAIAMNKHMKNAISSGEGHVCMVSITGKEDSQVVNISFYARFSTEKLQKHSTGKVLLTGGYYKDAQEVTDILSELSANFYSYLILGNTYPLDVAKIAASKEMAL